MHVSLSALEKALRLVDDLAETDDPADFGERALPGLDRLIPCDSLSYNEIGPAPGRVVTCSHPAGLVTPVTLAVFAAYMHEHPLVTHHRATGDGSPVKISDFLSRERFHRLGLYAEFFRHLPVEHQLAVSLPSPDTPDCRHCPQPQQRRFQRGRPRPSRCPARAADDRPGAC